MLTANGKGFKMTFENGNTVSVQWGPTNYADICDGQDKPKACQTWSSKTAEIAAWNAKKEWHNFECDQVAGWQTTDEVSAFMEFVRNNELDTDDGGEE